MLLTSISLYDKYISIINLILLLIETVDPVPFRSTVTFYCSIFKNSNIVKAMLGMKKIDIAGLKNAYDASPTSA